MLSRENHVFLTICVIGRNAERELSSLKRSVTEFVNHVSGVEIIYVDSASSDLSVEIAKTFCDKVYVLAESKNLNASAGRYVGTRYAKGDWILYLDSDMTLCLDFHRILCSLMENKNYDCGYVGEYEYIYEDGRSRVNALNLANNGKTVDHFGGAVVLPRLGVIRAGNWNPRLFSNEEIELYTRLKSIDIYVLSTGLPMIKHHTIRKGKWSRLVENFFPTKDIGKKFYGFGQVLNASLRGNHLANLIRYFPYPFVTWAVGIVATALLCLNLWLLAFLILSLGFAFIAFKKAPRFVVVYAGMFIQGCMGFHRYDRHYYPELLYEWEHAR